MTIITKPITDKKPLEKPLVLNEVIGADGSVSDGNPDDVEAWLSPSARRRVSTTTTVCAFIMALIVMSLGIIGGVYLYRQIADRKMARFQGWCGIPYEKSSLHIVRNDKILGVNQPFFRDDAEWMADKTQLFREGFDLDLETNLHEEIYVPDFGHGSATFIHNFIYNKTWIVDKQSKRCFVKPLDRDHVLPPTELYDFIRKMSMGYYMVDTRVLHKEMIIVRPPVKMEEKMIDDKCKNYPIYEIVPANDGIRKKRDTDSEKEVYTIAEFAGKNIVEMTIHDPNGNE